MINFRLFVSIITILIYSTTINVFGQDTQETKVIPDVVYGYKDGMALTLDVYQPGKQNGAAVIFINSGGFQSPFFVRQYEVGNEASWDMIPKEEMMPEFMQQVSFKELLENGFVVFEVRHSSSPRYMLDEITSDCESAITYIKKYAESYHISKDRLGIWGASAGGYLAGYLSANPKPGNEIQAAGLYFPAGYDFLNPYNDPVRQALPSLNISDKKLDTLSIKHYLSEKTPPTIILYGALDQPFITEPSDSIYLDLKKYKVPTEKIVLGEVGHIWRDKDGVFKKHSSDEAMKNLVAWFLKYL